jgi:cysteinyl-tRNA synthetase
MSKSLGNFRVVRDILKSVPRDVLRLFLLSAHYRSPLDFNTENIGSLQKGYEELYRTLMRLQDVLRLIPAQPENSPDPDAQTLDQEIRENLQRFEANLDDDLNTAQAIGQIFSLANRVKQMVAGRAFKITQARAKALRSAFDAFLAMAGVLGVVPEFPAVPQDVLSAITAREAARSKKDWAEADRLRALIVSAGWTVEDTSLGPLTSPAKIGA